MDSKYNENPTRFNYLYALVQAEVETNTAKNSSSCTNGLLWLTRYVLLVSNSIPTQTLQFKHKYEKECNSIPFDLVF